MGAANPFLGALTLSWGSTPPTAVSAEGLAALGEALGATGFLGAAKGHRLPGITQLIRGKGMTCTPALLRTLFPDPPTFPPSAFCARLEKEVCYLQK